MADGAKRGSDARCVDPLSTAGGVTACEHDARVRPEHRRATDRVSRDARRTRAMRRPSVDTEGGQLIEDVLRWSDVRGRVSGEQQPVAVIAPMQALLAGQPGDGGRDRWA